MRWDYRVIMNEFGELCIHEVYYNEQGIPTSCGSLPTTVVSNNIFGLLEELKRMKEACTKPVIDQKYFIKLEPKAHDQLNEEDNATDSGQ